MKLCSSLKHSDFILNSWHQQPSWDLLISAKLKCSITQISRAILHLCLIFQIFVAVFTNLTFSSDLHYTGFTECLLETMTTSIKKHTCATLIPPPPQSNPKKQLKASPFNTNTQHKWVSLHKMSVIHFVRVKTSAVRKLLMLENLTFYWHLRTKYHKVQFKVSSVGTHMKRTDLHVAMLIRKCIIYSYRCATPSLSKQLLPHRLFIEPRASLHIDSPVLGGKKKCNQMRRGHHESDLSDICIFTTSIWSQQQQACTVLTLQVCV